MLCAAAVGMAVGRDFKGRKNSVIAVRRCSPLLLLLLLLSFASFLHGGLGDPLLPVPGCPIPGCPIPGCSIHSPPHTPACTPTYPPTQPRTTRCPHLPQVIGDGAITGGMAYEAMNHAGFLDKNMIVILNDNQQVHNGTQQRATTTQNSGKQQHGTEGVGVWREGRGAWLQTEWF